MKIASFDVDAQKGFTPLCPNELPVPGGDAIAPALNQLAARASLRLGSGEHGLAATAHPVHDGDVTRALLGGLGLAAAGSHGRGDCQRQCKGSDSAQQHDGKALGGRNLRGS